MVSLRVIHVLQRGKSGDVSQWDLELLYGRVIQWAFLVSKAKKCLRDQDKQAVVCVDEISVLLSWLRYVELRHFISGMDVLL